MQTLRKHLQSVCILLSLDMHCNLVYFLCRKPFRKLSIGSAAHTVFVDRVCIILATDIFELTPALDTVLGGVTEVTQARVAGGPIPVELLSFQH
jgi:hypothetical protein